MGPMTALVGWIARKFILFILLVAALIAYQQRPWIEKQVSDRWTAQQVHKVNADRLDRAVRELRQQSDSRRAQLDERGEWAQKQGERELQRAIAAAEADLAALRRSVRPDFQRKLSLVKLDTDAILRDRQTDVTIRFREREIEGLNAALGALRAQQEANRQSREGLKKYQSEAKEKWENWVVRVPQYRDLCVSAEKMLQSRKDGYRIEREIRDLVQETEAELKRNRDVACGNYRIAIANQQTWNVEKERRAKQVAGAATRARAWVNTNFQPAVEDLIAQSAGQRRLAEKSLAGKARRFWTGLLEPALVPAAKLLALIILTPLAIRILFYWVFAPLAERRPSIRLRSPGGSRVHDYGQQESRPSIAVRLAKDEELVVRQGYLQTSSLRGEKKTRFLLDWWHPLTSLATGLVFLTRIRGEGETAVISAASDPFAEISCLRLSGGDACVIHPRAIVGVITPVSEPLRVTRHWRLFSVNAWLTMQLRYLVFYGPARILLKGGRGVRMEQAETGRVFGQEQLIGFSADLRYSVTRTETFWPYFFGQTQLLRDKVEEGDGLIIIEEAPMSTRQKRGVRKGLEGAFDAVLKAFGM